MVETHDHPLGIVDFPNKDPQERFCSSFRQHWIRMLWPIVRTFLMTLVIFGIGLISFSIIDVSQGNGRHVLLLSLVLFFLAVQMHFISRFYQYFLYVIIVTDRRVHRIKRSLLNFDDHECIDLWNIQEIRKSQRGPVQNLFGFGTVVLEGQDSRLTLHFVPQVSWRYEELLALRELARRTSGPVSM